MRHQPDRCRVESPLPVRAMKVLPWERISPGCILEVLIVTTESALCLSGDQNIFLPWTCNFGCRDAPALAVATLKKTTFFEIKACETEGCWVENTTRTCVCTSAGAIFTPTHAKRTPGFIPSVQVTVGGAWCSIRSTPWSGYIKLTFKTILSSINPRSNCLNSQTVAPFIIFAFSQGVKSLFKP